MAGFVHNLTKIRSKQPSIF